LAECGDLESEEIPLSRQLEAPTLAAPQSEAITPYAMPINEVLARLGSDAQRGLRSDQVAASRTRFGWNELTEAPPTPLWQKLLAQFKDLVIWILIVAAVISGAIGEWPDTVAILAIVLLNGLLGFFQEERAEQSLAALQKLSAPLAKVIRDGALQTLPARDLMPGDLVELEAGDNIPADARLIRAFGLRVQEAALTGESVPVEKDADCVLGITAPLGDRRNMVYMGTVLAAGKTSAVVVATGMHTELGRIAGMLARYEPEPTPLQRRLAELGKILIVACFVIVGLIFSLQMLRGGSLLQVLLLAISLAVAAVPEGLPAVVTMALALGLQRMVKRNALIRKLPSVETLGAVTVICSDKTGTLTRNEMTVREIVAGGERFQVTGAGYAPRGQFLKTSPNDRQQSVDPEILDPRHASDLFQALTVGTRCNNARITPQGDGSETWRVIGDPTEGALVVAALKAGIDANNGRHRVDYEIPFDSERKAMSVVMREDGKLVMYTKGAPEIILSKCSRELRAGNIEPLTDARRSEIIETNSQMASRALRVLALSYREIPEDGARVYEERDLVFAGLVGMIDPPREEAKEAVRKCHEAGIRPVMITGDHPATAVAIARELHISTEGDRAITGQELDGFSDDELAKQVEHISVYARVSAEHKLRVVRAWKSRKQVVAMTGDGVNDAPAVQAADIGIAMGVSGTDVTKEAAAMVLTDDNFASIVNAVEEGRCIYDNIQKVLFFLLSCNVGEILLMLVASLLGWPAPLLPIQLLWINLVTDGLPALALSLEKPEPGIMQRKPRSPKESMLSMRSGLTILLQGALVGGVTLIAFGVVYLTHPNSEEAVGRARTMAFCVLVYAELLRALAARSQTLTLTQLGLFSNPQLLGAIGLSFLLQLSVVMLPFARPVFESVQHFAWEWILLFGLALTPAAVIEALKVWNRRATAQLVSQ
jgi:Ca2+-transporting ATPase